MATFPSLCEVNYDNAGDITIFEEYTPYRHPRRESVAPSRVKSGIGRDLQTTLSFYEPYTVGCRTPTVSAGPGGRGQVSLESK